jgi:hypothetical protein
VVVDACEIGQYNGTLTLRVGSEFKPPTCMAIPATDDLVDYLRSASLDAEELHWETLTVALSGAAPGDKEAATAAMQTWLLRQDWAGVVDRVPAMPGQMFVVSSWGHVELVIAPPFTRVLTLAIFDPMQLRRLARSFQSGLAAAHANSPPPLPRAPRLRSWTSYRRSRGRCQTRDSGSPRLAKLPLICAAGTSNSWRVSRTCGRRGTTFLTSNGRRGPQSGSAQQWSSACAPACGRP